MVGTHTGCLEVTWERYEAEIRGSWWTVLLLEDGIPIDHEFVFEPDGEAVAETELEVYAREAALP